MVDEAHATGVIGENGRGTPELIASDNVNAGDVLLLEDGIYHQTVNIAKNNIRIAAKGPEVIFDGRSTLGSAFTLSNVTGVVIAGIKMRHYRFNGVLIASGSGNRIIQNIISNTLSNAIDVRNSSSNLIWKNEICNCFDAVPASDRKSNLTGFADYLKLQYIPFVKRYFTFAFCAPFLEIHSKFLTIWILENHNTALVCSTSREC
jgi:hypothetical protein